MSSRTEPLVRSLLVRFLVCVRFGGFHAASSAEPAGEFIACERLKGLHAAFSTEPCGDMFVWELGPIILPPVPSLLLVTTDCVRLGDSHPFTMPLHASAPMFPPLEHSDSILKLGILVCLALSLRGFRQLTVFCIVVCALHVASQDGSFGNRHQADCNRTPGELSEALWRQIRY